MNRSVAQMLANDAARQMVLQEINDRQEEMVEEISRLNTKMNTLLELLDCVVTQNRFLQLRLNELLTRQGVGISVLPQLPNERQEAVVNNALQRHQERIGGPPALANQPANPPNNPIANSTAVANAAPPANAAQPANPPAVAAGPAKAPTVTAPAVNPPTNPPNR